VLPVDEAQALGSEHENQPSSGRPSDHGSHSICHFNEL